MVLQTSGAITLSDIRGEFGGAAPDLLSEYYRGGGLVPDSPANSGIPTSGEISLADFYGGDASSGSVTLTNHSSNHFDPGTFVTAGFAFDTDGTLYGIGPSATTETLLDAGEWWSERPETGIGSSYEVRCASVGLGQSWDLQAAAVGTWIDMSAERVWRVNVTAMESPASQTVNGTFEIRLLGGDGTVLASGSLSATAEN